MHPLSICILSMHMKFLVPWRSQPQWQMAQPAKYSVSWSPLLGVTELGASPGT